MKLIPIKEETALLLNMTMKGTGLDKSDFLLLLLEKYRISKLNKK